MEETDNEVKNNLKNLYRLFGSSFDGKLIRL